MEYKRVCKLCGREFITLEYRVQYCSDACREIGAKIKYTQAKQRELERAEELKLIRRMNERAEAVAQRMSLLSADARAAKDQGLTYGKWRIAHERG